MSKLSKVYDAEHPGGLEHGAVNVMSPVHPEWNAFCNALGGEGYCNFRKGEKDRDCQHDHGHTRALLADEWPEIDVEATLELFREHHGFCDCEVLFNVTDAWGNLHGLGAAE
jgi:hypothetical protein